ncbi:MAG: right-handed parallel beta-helix repeat-containing protein [Candidatus Bathyarchaeota archaeon]
METLTAVDLADGSIITIKIADGAVTIAKIADDAVTAAKIEDSTVTSEKIFDSAIITTKLADGSVTSAKIQNGTLTAESSFLIWKDGSTYYAKNGSTGAIQHFGTNATAVINNAISSLPTGGLVFLRDATYNIDGTITVVEKLNINIIGESWETKINLTQNSSTDMMKISNSNFTTIKSLYFQGNRDSQTSGRGIVVHNSERVLIERCIFYEIKQTAIYVYGETPRSSLQPWITGNYIEKIGNSSSDHGIWIGDYASDAHVLNNDVGRVTGSALYVTSSGFLIVSNTCWDSMYGLNAYLVTSGGITSNMFDGNEKDGINIDSCKNLLVVGNVAKLNSNNPINVSSGIYLYNSSYIIITGNRAGSVDDYEVETQQYGIKEYGVYSDYNLITGNNVYGNLGYEDIYSTGPNTVVSGNLGRYTAKNPS